MKTHAQNILVNLGANDRTHAVMIALNDHGLENLVTGTASEQSRQKRAATRATHARCLGTQSTHS